MGNRVIISVTSDLSTDQRVQKVAFSLQSRGFDVLLYGRKLKSSRSFHPSYRYRRMKLLFNKGFLFYAEYNIRLFILLFHHKADIHYACDTDTLLANYLASKISGRKLIFDAHEIFPEVPELVKRKFVKKCWTIIEYLIIPRLTYTITVCDSIAKYYHEKYGINMRVIRNMAYLDNTAIKPLVLAQDKKVILYQGALNVGRGLEWVIKCMPYLDNCVLIIIGSGKLKYRLRAGVSKLRIKDKVQFMGKILPDELPKYTKGADIGLCLLEERGLSYYYSLPNRVFDYIQAGLPILATDFPEISKIISTYNTGVVINHYEPKYLAQVITEMLEKGKEVYQKNFNEIKKELCWEKEQEKLFDLLAEIWEEKSKKHK